MNDNEIDPLFVMMLDGLVPLWIEKLKGRTLGELEARGRDLGQVIACKSDRLIRGVSPGDRKARAEHESILNAVAEGIAIGAFMPGGVRFAGLHFEATHPERVP